MDINEMIQQFMIPAIVVICYGVGDITKKIKKIADELIPFIVCIVGIVMTIVGMYTVPDFPATNIVTAIASGFASGLFAIGVNQMGKQLAKFMDKEQQEEQ